jgi:uncharacterized membrane protein YphA (DoxX/SURF4 family)
MDQLFKLGRVFFSIPMIAFGIQYLIYSHYAGGLPPVPPWAPGGKLGAWLVGAFLIIAGACIAANRNSRLWATLLGFVFLLCVFLFHSQKLHDVIYDGTERTRAFEPLALGAAAFVLAALLPAEPLLGNSWNSIAAGLSLVGRLIFAFTSIIFGIQHFLYAPFIAFLIPAWIPAHLFFAYFTGIAFIAAGLSIAFKILYRLSSLLLALMFFLWTVLLHAPRVASKLHNGDEWSSLFVALAMCGCFLIFARASSSNRSAVSL